MVSRKYMRRVDSVIKSGDCANILLDYPDNFFDLIVTSPPYADCREKTYGGIKPDAYVEWFLPKSEQFLRVLKPTGTFVLNIKEKVVAEQHAKWRDGCEAASVNEKKLRWP